jgi:hypothetical protein
MRYAGFPKMLEDVSDKVFSGYKLARIWRAQCTAYGCGRPRGFGTSRERHEGIFRVFYFTACAIETSQRDCAERKNHSCANRLAGRYIADKNHGDP